ncbi:DUF1697 domain-containing protein [Agromyces seonyuensis]|uniref:DUF1697 domain-containing protein n=1 Tax=Agromyces seonyuensis TaxID=2662446 RepID=A0A6I4NZG9_9MICO|nr:DUF1697 domain-containing protein [Agromyces seonyuensis]MWB99716.1 DUF1697 domain-containing protein [Agromyces seonyuensis]
MTDWIALLRGVNVGGITVRSAELAELFRDLGFEGVRTVLASGNVAFASDDADAGALKSRIEAALGERFGYDAWIVLLTREALAAAADGFPFDADDPSRQPYLVFGSDDAVLDELAGLAADPESTGDPVAPGTGVLYWSPVKGTTITSPFGVLLGKAKYKPTTTTRNLRTVAKLLG